MKFYKVHSISGTTAYYDQVRSSGVPMFPPEAAKKYAEEHTTHGGKIFVSYTDIDNTERTVEYDVIREFIAKYVGEKG